MPVYLVAQITIHDEERYAQYTGSVMPVLAAHGGTLLVATGEHETLEGEWPASKLIVIKFDTREAALNWLKSPEYGKVAAHRHAAATTNLVIADELDLSAFA